MSTGQAKSYFAMPRGLNTEAPLINFPDGFTTDELNYELQINGSRRRRPGLALEEDGELIPISSGYNAGDAVRVFDWENVSGIPTINLLVMQVGYNLYIFDDTNPVSPTLKSTPIDFRPYRVSNATDDQVASHPLEAAFGRGHLFLFGKYTTPFYIEYDTDDEAFILIQINILERDFEGIDDGVPVSTEPASSTDSHIYNLKNRGWIDAYINTYTADQSRLPSKAMIPWLGLRRALTVGDYYDADGIRSFDSDKLVAELFQDASAPSGHFVKNPFDTTTVPETTLGIPIVTWSISGTTPGTQTLTIDTDGAHGLSPTDSIQIVDLVGTFVSEIGTFGEWVVQALQVNGTYTVVATPDADTFTIQVTFPNYPFVQWYEQFRSLGTVVGGAVPNPSGNVVDFRPKAGAFFAGRAWFAGVDTSRLTGRVYFSQVIESDEQYGKCYQVADPTDERISDLVPSDGGVILIPEASNVLKLLPYESSLLVYASNGVWEIGPGDLGYFAANSYSIRKLTDSGTVSAAAVILADNTPMHWGVTDIYAIRRDPRQGFLYEENISQTTINTFYNTISLDAKHEVIGVYDDLSKRAIWVFAKNINQTNAFDRSLMLDLRLGAFTVNGFAFDDDNFVGGVFILKEAGEVAKVKYIGILDDGTNIAIGEPSNYTDYTDFGIDEPECYLITGFDSLQDPSTFKEAPYITVYSRKTEEGYDEDTLPIRPSSTQMRTRWDWADHANASKWGRYQEVYRHRRTYIPSDPTTDTYNDGTPVVITRNSLRGMGRVLQLEFRAGEGKDSWLQGWKTNFMKAE